MRTDTSISLSNHRSVGMYMKGKTRNPEAINTCVFMDELHNRQKTHCSSCTLHMSLMTIHTPIIIIGSKERTRVHGFSLFCYRWIEDLQSSGIIHKSALFINHILFSLRFHTASFYPIDEWMSEHISLTRTQLTGKLTVLFNRISLSAGA